MEHNLQELLEMYTYRRPHLGETVDLFVKDFLLPIDGLIKCEKSENYIIDIGAGAPVTIFSSHVDTVHREDGRQKIIYSPDTGFVTKDDKQCLGADDATGVWLMKEMIAQHIPGRYIFHVGEEKGGIGSGDLLKDAPFWLKDIKHAVAFDRRGTEDVITYQAGGRCCSDEFAKELSNQMNAGGLKYKPCDGGVFTDTATYTETIKECTNLSVGYYSEHTMKEKQDIVHLLNMREALLQVDWANLPAVRDETVIDYGYSWGSVGVYGSGRGYRNRNSSRYNPSRYTGNQGKGHNPNKNPASHGYDAEAWGADGVYVPYNDRPSVIARRAANNALLDAAVNEEDNIEKLERESAEQLAAMQTSWEFGETDTHILSTLLGDDSEYPDKEMLRELCLYDTAILVEVLHRFLSLTNKELKQEVEYLNIRDRIDSSAI